MILSRDGAIPPQRRTLVGSSTTTVRRLVSEVVLEPGDDRVPQDCAINLDSIASVPVAVLANGSDASPTSAWTRCAPLSK